MGKKEGEKAEKSRFQMDPRGIKKVPKKRGST
jgi:hypothetical protein